MESETIKNEPILTGEWRYGNGYFSCGTLRIARLDIDTNPPKELKERLGNYICNTLNAANESGNKEAPASAVEALVSGTQWVSIRDEMPEYRKRVLVYIQDRYSHKTGVKIAARSTNDKDEKNGGWNVERGRYSGGFTSSGYSITHWMPFPEPPKDA